MGLYAVLDIFGTKALRNAHVTIFQNMFHCLQRDTTLNYLTKVKLKVVGSVFFGKDCTEKCPVPSYGAACQSICSCSHENCHYVFGCKRPASGNIYL